MTPVGRRPGPDSGRPGRAAPRPPGSRRLPGPGRRGRSLAEPGRAARPPPSPVPPHRRAGRRTKPLNAKSEASRPGIRAGAGRKQAPHALVTGPHRREGHPTPPGRAAPHRRMVRPALRDRPRPVGGRARRAPGPPARVRRRLLRRLLAARHPVPGGPRRPEGARAAGGRLQRPSGAARRGQAADLALRPGRHGRRRPPEAPGRAVRAEPAPAVRLHPAPAARPEHRPALHGREDRLHHHPVQLPALHLRPVLPGRRRPGGAAAAVGRGDRGVRRVARRTGPARAERPHQRGDRLRGGDRGPADRLRQSAGRRAAAGHRPGLRPVRAGPARPLRRRRDLRDRLPDARHDDRHRRRHRLRPLPGHPAPAEPRRRPGPGDRRRERRSHQRARGAALRLHGDHRAVGAVGLRHRLHRQARPGRGGHRRHRGARRPHPRTGGPRSDRPPYRPRAGEETGRRDRPGPRGRGARRLAPVRAAGGAAAVVVPGRRGGGAGGPVLPPLHPARPSATAPTRSRSPTGAPTT